MIEDLIEEILSTEEVRVLGCLMEKQMTTPDYYPLTLKALTAACNQKSSRVPVMSLNDSEVGGVVNGLRRGRGLITARMDGRVDRFEQHLSRKLRLPSKERAIICVLMLRGALTLNEIHINTGRMVTFESREELQELIEHLMGRDEPLLVRIPHAAGQREDRYAHLLCGEAEIEASATPGSSGAGQDRITLLEQEVADLKHDIQRLYELTGLEKT